jgi:hypothetical protein
MRKSPHLDLLIVLLLSLPASSCDEEQDAADSGTGAVPDSSSTTPDSGFTTQDSGAAASCSDVRERAIELLESAQQCETDSDCTLISLAEPCIDTFLCQLPVNAETDVDAFAREAGKLIETYRECMNSCFLARCITSDQLQVLCFENRCSSIPLREVP